VKSIVIVILIQLITNITLANDRAEAIRYSIKAIANQSNDVKQVEKRIKFLYKSNFSKEQREWLGTGLSILKIIEKKEVSYTWHF
jgi:hypothetical protein